jgi:hypothetical protein
MPWKECHKMGEKIRFGARYPDGEKTLEAIARVRTTASSPRSLCKYHLQSG